MSGKKHEEVDFRRDVNPNSVYELTALLGEGSYGAVYRGRSRDDHNNEEVAIKIIPDADDDLTALWREIRFLQVLRSPFVVSFIESLLFDNELWLVMELCDGGSLHDLKEAMKTTFNEAQLKVIISYSVLGLQHLHSQMSIHRDVKSGNILITKDGRAKLGDFGISAQLTDTIMKRRTVIGSPYWMAPEVIQETSYDSKADIWSLGITLLELCEGHPPHFNVHPMRAIFIISSKPAPTLREPDRWSADMVDFVSRCLVKDCDARASADELIGHPWIRRTVRDIGPKCNGSPLLQNLISEHWTEIERIRFSKFKLPDALVGEDDLAAAVAASNLRESAEDNDDNARTMDRSNSKQLNYRSNSSNSMVNYNDGEHSAIDESTMRTLRSSNSVSGMPATRQQMRNASLSRSTTPTATIRVRSINGLASLSLADNKRQDCKDSGGDALNNKRVSRSAAGRLISVDSKYGSDGESNPYRDVGSKDVTPLARSGDAKRGARDRRDRSESPPTPRASHGGGHGGRPTYDYPSVEDEAAGDGGDYGTMLAGSMVRRPPPDTDAAAYGLSGGDNGGTYIRVPLQTQPSGQRARDDDGHARDGRDAGKQRGGGKSDISAALKYFRDDGPAPAHAGSGAKEVPRDSASAASAVSGTRASSSSSSSVSAADGAAAAAKQRELQSLLDPSSYPEPSEEEVLQRNQEFKKLILKQLSALKKQYRDDLEELTEAYEQRRKVLKDSLNMFVTDASATPSKLSDRGADSKGRSNRSS